MRSALVAVAATVLLFAGCSDDDSARPSSAESAIPKCRDLWIEGHPLPAEHAGCRRNGTIIQPIFFRCHDGSGREFVSYPDKGLFAVLGDPIQALPLPKDLLDGLAVSDVCRF